MTKAAADRRTPLMVAWVGGSGRPVVELSRVGVPAFTDPHRAVDAFTHLYDRDVPGREPHAPRAAGAAASDLGFPAVVKDLTSELAHKSDSGGVVLNLGSVAEVEAAAEALLSRRGKDLPADTRALVQRMVPSGRELLVGTYRDPTFGPVMAVGMGGTLAELFNDVSIRVPPLQGSEARVAMQRLRGARTLSGFRGEPVADIDAIVEAVSNLSVRPHRRPRRPDRRD